MKIEDACLLLKVLADPSRLKIVRILSNTKKACANDLLPKVECKQATLSHHMALLAESDLVNAKKNGNKVFYSLNFKTYNSLLYYLGIEKEEKPVEQPKAETVVEVKPVEQLKPVTVAEEPKKEEPVNVTTEVNSKVERLMYELPIYLL